MPPQEGQSPFQFAIGLRFELFFALQLVTDPASRVHSTWKSRALESLPPRFNSLYESLGSSSLLWGALPDALESQDPALGFKEILDCVRALPIRAFQRRIILGQIHYEDLVDELLSGKSTLKQTISRVPKAKQEWLAFAGLYPLDLHSPIAKAIESLLAEPEAFRDRVIETLAIFWKSVFKSTWERLQPQLSRSLEEKERLFRSCTLGEFARQALLRVSIEEREHDPVIHAIRGGYQLPVSKIERCFFLPSAFNDKRYWTAYETKSARTIAYFPYFDPAISLDLALAGASSAIAEPDLDPALIFKAMGDTTRFAILSLLARSPRSSVELAKDLGVSKPTISHHVNQLREAGLLQEQYEAGSVRLSVRRETLERLSELTIQRLFHAEGRLKISKTRGTKKSS